jgi:UDP-N-acetylglucosamine--N-acetylmuramyl-(pentapeptide) pyrophosphoryl-undecaprenol N-acetylglucosamine transferase
VAEDHQTKNAMALVENNAAILIKDLDSKAQLFHQTFSLLADKTKLKSLSENIKKLARPNAARDIVDVVMEVVKT